LFVVACTGQIAVLDTQTGYGSYVLRDHKALDDITYDAASKRVYAAGVGAVDIFEQSSPDSYSRSGTSLPAHGKERVSCRIKAYFVPFRSTAHKR